LNSGCIFIPFQEKKARTHTIVSAGTTERNEKPSFLFQVRIE
jgi:hypothetical protein